MIFIDSNVPMYLVGTPHPHKQSVQRLLEDFLKARTRLVTDAEVLQEILHRYTAIKRHDAIQPAFDALLEVVDQVLPVDLPAVESAKSILFGSPNLSARDALHVAVMRANGVQRILSYDAGFDQVAGLTRVH